MAQSQDGGDSLTRSPLLHVKYAMNSIVEVTLSPECEVVRGLVYCTDEQSNSVVLKRSLTHTTLSSEIRVIHVSSILEATVVRAVDGTKADENDDNEIAVPLVPTNLKALEEREKRAIRLAQESFKHINQKATPEGQAVFDRLLKACNEVVWKGESILVLKQVQIDPPYAHDNCKLISRERSIGGEVSSLNEDSLERVRKIVEATF